MILKKLLKFINRRIPSILFNIHNIKIIPFSINNSIFLENLYAIFNRRSIRFSFDKEKNLIRAKDRNLIRFYSDRNRCFWLYRNGIFERGKLIQKTYCLSQIKFARKDIVVDCGANSGDLLIQLNNYIENGNYIGIEPNPIDFKVLKLNCPNQILINKALGDKNDNLNFYIATSGGDSSIIKPKHYEKVIKVEVIKLDNLIKSLGIKKIKLLKLEAEGFEPEILEGAPNTIPICEYIAIDGGYERGQNQEQTFTNLTNILLKNNFEIHDINFSWHRALFKNTRDLDLMN